MNQPYENPWTDERIKNLKQLDSEGFSFSEIARALGGGLTRNACIGKARRLGLPHRRDPALLPTEPKPRDYKKEYRLKAARQGSSHIPSNNNRPPMRINNGRISRAEMYEHDILPMRELTADAIPIEQRVTQMNLEDHHCRFPYGDPKSPDFFFCGGKKHRGAYCAYHAQISYHNPPRLTNAERERLRQLRATAARLSIEQNRAVG